MTEVERIIKEGALPKSFFKPEMICDFYVDENRKKIWAVGLDLLFKLDSVCRKHNLKYFLAYGSLLGAIRHGGFIPWDDDIDVWMPRKDYDALLSYKYDFDEPYFLQYPESDKGYYFSFTKLRNSSTSAISNAFRYENFNQGLFLDIFPLDNYNEDTIEEDTLKLKSLINECSLLMRINNPYLEESDIERLQKTPISHSGPNLIKEINSILRRNNNIPSDSYISESVLVYHYSKSTYKKNLFEIQEINYYEHPIYVPAGYKQILNKLYGNYMEFPPIEERGKWHQKVTFDPDSNYVQKLQELRKADTILLRY